MRYCMDTWLGALEYFTRETAYTRDWELYIIYTRVLGRHVVVSFIIFYRIFYALLLHGSDTTWNGCFRKTIKMIFQGIL